MSPLLSKEDMDAMDSGNESYNVLISTEMLENICDGVCDRNRQRQSEWKGALKATLNMGKGLHKVFKTVVKEILQELLLLGESGSAFSHFIPEPRNFSEVKNISD